MIRFTILLLATVTTAPLIPQGCPLMGPVDNGDTPLVEREDIATTATASAGDAEAGLAVKLTADAQADPNQGEIQYTWFQTGGPGVQIADHSQPVASFVAPSLQTEKTLRFMVTTGTDSGAAGRAEVGVVVLRDPSWTEPLPGGLDDGSITPSVGPVADAGSDRPAVPADDIVLDGSNSSGQQPLTYAWRQLSGPTVDLQGADTNQANFTVPAFVPDETNECVFQLRVSDGRDRSASDEVTIVIRNPEEVGTRVKLETSFGDIVLELFPDDAPITVENFLQYVDDGFFDNTIFHRVIPGFVVQGGGFLAGLTKKDTRDPIVNEASNGLSNTRGTISMARTDDPDSATSQFFINVANNVAGGGGQSDLDPGGVSADGYAVFGRVFWGLDVLDRIAAVQTTSRNGMQDVPVQDILIRTATRVD